MQAHVIRTNWINEMCGASSRAAIAVCAGMAVAHSIGTIARRNNGYDKAVYQGVETSGRRRQGVMRWAADHAVVLMYTAGAEVSANVGNSGGHSSALAAEVSASRAFGKDRFPRSTRAVPRLPECRSAMSTTAGAPAAEQSAAWARRPLHWGQRRHGLAQERRRGALVPPRLSRQARSYTKRETTLADKPLPGLAAAMATQPQVALRAQRCAGGGGGGGGGGGLAMLQRRPVARWGPDGLRARRASCLTSTTRRSQWCVTSAAGGAWGPYMNRVRVNTRATAADKTSALFGEATGGGVLD
eukprot:scaffold1387_cov382-Prasinococcus_capsulatus_cf.AAC.10